MEDTKATGIELSIIKDIEARQQLGIKKYGQTVEENPLTLKQWLQHAYEETLDQAIYLKRAMEELSNNLELVVFKDGSYAVCSPIDSKLLENEEQWLTTITLPSIDSSAVELYQCILKHGENGINIRYNSQKWRITDHWNNEILGEGQTLKKAIENIPELYKLKI